MSDNWKAVAEAIGIERAMIQEKLAQYEAGLEHIARADFGLTGDEDPAKLMSVIFDLQNHASAILAGVEPVTGADMARTLVEAGALSSSTRGE